MKIVQFMASAKYVGAERSFVELSNELAKNHEVYALVVPGCEYKLRFTNVTVIELHHKSRYNPLLYLEIARIIRSIDPDVVHAHSAKATQILYRLWKWMRFPFVATKRNSERKSRTVHVFDKVPIAVGVSEEVVASIRNPNRYLVYNGIEPISVQEQKEPVFTMIAIGILQPRKGFLELIESVAKLSFDFCLWIVGEGEQRKQLEAKIEALGLQEKVRLLGKREDVPSLMARAHLQIINSKREGLSRVLIEGIFYSDVVISTEVAGSTELLPKELLFKDTAAKIRDVYENYDRYKKIFASVKERYQPLLRLDRVAKEYETIYEKARNV